MALVSADGRWVAVFKTGLQDADGEELTREEQVVCWRETGDGRVHGIVLAQGTLEDAETSPAFLAYVESEYRRTVVAAEPGWWVVVQQDDDTADWRRVVAWLVEPNGFAVQAMTVPQYGEDTEPWDIDDDCRFVYAPYRQVEGPGPWPGDDEKGEAGT